MIMMIGAAVLGAGMGYLQNEKRKAAADRELQMAQLNQDAAASRLSSRKQILEGQLTIGALQTTAQNREGEMQAFQAKAAREAAVATSGTSGGTAFHLLGQEIIDNRRRLTEAASSGRAQMAMTAVEGRAGIKEAEFGLMGANFGLEDARDQANYLNSPFAAGMAMATGAMSGVSMAANLNQSVHSLTGFTIGEQFGGKTGPDGAPMVGTLNNFFSNDRMVQPEFGSAYNKNYTAPSSLPSFGGVSAPLQNYPQPQGLMMNSYMSPAKGKNAWDSGYFNQQSFFM